MVRRTDGLRPLQVRVAGNVDFPVRVGKIDKHTQQLLELLFDLAAGILEEQTHIGCHLVVSTAGSVELGSLGNFLGESLLDVHMHILEGCVPLKFARFDSL